MTKHEAEQEGFFQLTFGYKPSEKDMLKNAIDALKADNIDFVLVLDRDGNPEIWRQ